MMEMVEMMESVEMVEGMNKLSIIVPMYNGEANIEQCLESICSQTYPALELIVIDDGSKDNSYEKAKNFLQQRAGENLEYQVLHRENHGVAATRNFGISIATGTYIAFIDQDDYILPGYCETYVQAAKKQQADIVIGGFQRITREGTITRTVSLQPLEWSKLVVTAPWAHIYKREFLRNNNIEFLSTGIGEDIYFNLLACAYTGEITILDDTSYMWVDNPKSVSNSIQNSINEKANPLYLMDKLAERLPKESCLTHAEEEYFFMRYIVWYFSFTLRGSSKEAVEAMYEKLMAWLRAHYPDYRKNPNRSIGRPKGDTLSIRGAVWLFYLLEGLGLLPWCLKLLAKKNKKESMGE